MRTLEFLAIVNSVICQGLYSGYNLSSIEMSEAGVCPSTVTMREKIKQDVDIFLNNTVYNTNSLEHIPCVRFVSAALQVILMISTRPVMHTNRRHMA